MVATLMLYAAWLGYTVTELKTDVATLNAKMDYVNKLRTLD